MLFSNDILQRVMLAYQDNRRRVQIKTFARDDFEYKLHHLLGIHARTIHKM